MSEIMSCHQLRDTPGGLVAEWNVLSSNMAVSYFQETGQKHLLIKYFQLEYLI